MERYKYIAPHPDFKWKLEHDTRGYKIVFNNSHDVPIFDNDNDYLECFESQTYDDKVHIIKALIIMDKINIINQIFKTFLNFSLHYKPTTEILIKMASHCANKKMFEYLVNNGIDITICDNYAIKFVIDHLNKLVIQNNEYNFELRNEQSILECVQFLIDNGADVCVDRNYSIWNAAHCGYFNVVKLLSEYGANIHVDNEYILTETIMCGRIDMMRYLLDMGADPNGSNGSALRSAVCLQGASDEDIVAIVKILLDSGADINLLDEVALSCAIVYLHPNLIKLLLSQGVDFTIINKKNIKPELVEITNLLLDSGVDQSSLLSIFIN